MPDHGIQVLSDSKVYAPRLYSAVYSGFHCNHNVIRHTFFITDFSYHIIGDSCTKVHHCSMIQLQSPTPCNKLSLIKWRRLDISLRDPDLAAVGWVEIPGGGLPVIFHWILAHNNIINKYPRDSYILGIDTPCLNDLLYLGNDSTAVTLGRQYRRQYFQLHCFLRRCQISHLVTESPTDQTDINGNFFIKHILLVVIGNNIYNIRQGLCALVHLAAFHPGIDKCSQSHLGHFSRQTTGHASVQLGNLPLWQAVCLHLTVRNHLHPSGLKPPVRTDDPLHHPLVSKMLYTVFSVALSTGMKQSQSGRMPCLHKTCFQFF